MGFLRIILIAAIAIVLIWAASFFQSEHECRPGSIVTLLNCEKSK
jgi:hypothetical protein